MRRHRHTLLIERKPGVFESWVSLLLWVFVVVSSMLGFFWLVAEVI